MTLSIFESVIFYCIEKGRQLPYEVSPFGELFRLGKRLEGIVKKFRRGDSRIARFAL